MTRADPRCRASRSLRKEFHSHGTVVRAVDGVSFEVDARRDARARRRERQRQVDDRALRRAADDPTRAAIAVPRARTSPRCRARRFRALRRDIQMVFQDPHASLNPSMTVRQTLREPLKLHGGDGRDDGGAAARADGARAPRPGAARAARGPAQRRPEAACRDRAGDRDAARPSSCSTSRRRRSTCRCAWRCSACSPSCSATCGMAYLFITHDLSTVRQIARPRARHVPRQGRRAAGRGVLDTRDPYTQALIGDPVPEPAAPSPPRGRARTVERAARSGPLPARTRAPRQDPLPAGRSQSACLGRRRRSRMSRGARHATCGRRALRRVPRPATARA